MDDSASGWASPTFRVPGSAADPHAATADQLCPLPTSQWQGAPRASRTRTCRTTCAGSQLRPRGGRERHGSRPAGPLDTRGKSLLLKAGSTTLVHHTLRDPSNGRTLPAGRGSRLPEERSCRLRSPSRGGALLASRRRIALPRPPAPSVRSGVTVERPFVWISLRPRCPLRAPRGTWCMRIACCAIAA
jgi:hypothetical protein